MPLLLDFRKGLPLNSLEKRLMMTMMMGLEKFAQKRILNL
jgi:hypothetical protein